MQRDPFRCDCQLERNLCRLDICQAISRAQCRCRCQCCTLLREQLDLLSDRLLWSRCRDSKEVRPNSPCDSSFCVLCRADACFLTPDSLDRLQVERSSLRRAIPPRVALTTPFNGPLEGYRSTQSSVQDSRVCRSGPVRPLRMASSMPSTATHFVPHSYRLPCFCRCGTHYRTAVC